MRAGLDVCGALWRNAMELITALLSKKEQTKNTAVKLSSFQKYVDYISEYDEPIVFEQVKKDFKNLFLLIGAYWDLKTRRGRIVTVAIISVYLVNILVHMFLFGMTVAYSLGWSASISFQNTNAIFLGALCVCYLLTPFIRRREMSRMLISIGRGFYVYDVAISSADGRRARYLLEVFKKYYYVVPATSSLIIMFLGIFRQNEEILTNGLNPSLPLVLWYPFNVNTWPVYVAVLLTQMAISCEAFFILTVVSFDMFLMSFWWWVEMQHLIDSLKGIDHRARTMFSKRFGRSKIELFHGITDDNEDIVDCYVYCIKENLTHHRILRRFTSDLESAIGLAMLVTFLLFTFIFASSVYSLTTDSFVEQKIFALIAAFHVILSIFAICFVGQKFTDKNEEFRDTMYGLHWYKAHWRIQQVIKIFFKATQRPIIVKALGIVPLDLHSFTKFTQRAYAYYSALVWLSK